MDVEYDLFEMVDGRPIWRGHAMGLEAARVKLLHIGRATGNECQAIHLPTKEVAARINVHAEGGAKPVIIQISYDEQLATARSSVLRLQGYEVMSIVGNDAAKLLLDSKQRRCDLFMVGYRAPDAVRNEIVAWLRANYPGVPMLGLNQAPTPPLIGVDFTLNQDRPEVWLPVIYDAVKNRGTNIAC